LSLSGTPAVATVSSAFSLGRKSVGKLGGAVVELTSGANFSRKVRLLISPEASPAAAAAASSANERAPRRRSTAAPRRSIGVFFGRRTVGGEKRRAREKKRVEKKE
jgi:hypothetical protein